MKKVILTATALIFTVAMFAQTASAPKVVKTTPKNVVAQNTAKPAAEKAEVQTKGESKKEIKKEHKKGTHHAKKEHTKK